MSTLLCFAYGSNMFQGRIQKRLGQEVSYWGKATLFGHTVCYHKRSKDGSGKLTVVETGNATDVVLGVVYVISRTDEAQLDRFEGLGHGYDKKTVVVETVDGSREVVLSYATPEAIDPSLMPYDWYRELVLAGARQHGFLEEYVATLNVEAIEDPDEGRALRNRKLLM
jgi:gamma-glutamylcyclotransferase (GGCT)/AIG2-like uncharacterized protein YtfP